jgi:hypothetical protein
MIRTCIPAQTKADFLGGVHSTEDQYRIVLYTSAADLDENSSHYAEQGEVEGKGYRKGGVNLHNPKAWVDRGAGCLTWDSVTLPNSTVTARGYMIINASKGNRAVCIVDWGAEYTSTEGPFNIKIAADAVVFD